MMTLDGVRSFLQAVDAQPASRDSHAVRATLTSHKQEAVAQGNQEAARGIWCLEQVLDIQEHYLGRC